MGFLFFTRKNVKIVQRNHSLAKDTESRKHWSIDLLCILAMNAFFTCILKKKKKKYFQTMLINSNWVWGETIKVCAICIVSLLGDMLVVDEGSSVCLCGDLLTATDSDTKPDQLNFFLEIPPHYGFLENILPSPGFEKSNAGIQVGQY